MGDGTEEKSALVRRNSVTQSYQYPFRIVNAKSMSREKIESLSDIDSKLFSFIPF